MSHTINPAPNPLEKIPAPPRSCRNEALVALVSLIIIAVGFILRQHYPHIMTPGRWSVCTITGCTLLALSLLLGLDQHCRPTYQAPRPDGPAATLKPKERPLAEMTQEFFQSISIVQVNADGTVENRRGDDQVTILKAVYFRNFEHFKLFIAILTSLEKDKGLDYCPSKFTMKSGKMLFEYAINFLRQMDSEVMRVECGAIIHSLLAPCDGTEARLRTYFLEESDPFLPALLQISAKFTPSDQNNKPLIDRVNHLISYACNFHKNLQIAHLEIMENMKKNGFQFWDPFGRWKKDATLETLEKYIEQNPAKLDCFIKYLILKGETKEAIQKNYVVARIGIRDDQNLPILKQSCDPEYLRNGHLSDAIAHRSVKTVEWIIRNSKMDSAEASRLFFDLFDTIGFNANTTWVTDERLKIEYKEGSKARLILKALATFMTQNEFEDGMKKSVSRLYVTRSRINCQGLSLYYVLATELADSFKKP